MPFACLTSIGRSLNNSRQPFLNKLCEVGGRRFWNGRWTNLSRTRSENPPRVRVAIHRWYPLFTMCFSATTLQDVRLELAKDDAASSARGVVSLHDVTPTAFLTTGLDLEEQQYVLHRPFPCNT